MKKIKCWFENCRNKKYNWCKTGTCQKHCTCAIRKKLKKLSKKSSWLVRENYKKII